MLGRSPKNPNKTQNSYYTNMDQNKTSQSFMKSASPKATSFRIIPKNISDEDKVIYDSMM